MANIVAKVKESVPERPENGPSDEQEVFYFGHQPILDQVSHTSNLTNVSTQKDDSSAIEDEEKTIRFPSSSIGSNTSTINDLGKS
ncbi:hypothetical protein [Parasitella parasitica]|uniref:Uncharacterized protein n=1 Tax=Parasitella parasitica TaxID=35722 RepID=A0A0B7N196_9FUNG|nr:hypothetical protein [Parasitella parasitica]